jgi:hypothetical protein
MYAQKEELEKAAQQAEQEYYAWKGQITEAENNISTCAAKRITWNLLKVNSATNAPTCGLI